MDENSSRKPELTARGDAIRLFFAVWLAGRVSGRLVPLHPLDDDLLSCCVLARCTISCPPRAWVRAAAVVVLCSLTPSVSSPCFRPCSQGGQGGRRGVHNGQVPVGPGQQPRRRPPRRLRHAFAVGKRVDFAQRRSLPKIRGAFCTARLCAMLSP